MNNNVIVSCYAISINGNSKECNDDNLYINGMTLEQGTETKEIITKSYLKDSILISVFDGIGGLDNGDIASKICAENYSKLHDKVKKNFGIIDQSIVNEELNYMNEKLIDYCKENGLNKIGSTVASLYINRGKGYFFNIGDSSIYLFRDGFLKKLTNDHNEAAILLKMGSITEDEYLTHSKKNKLTQHLGMLTEEFSIEAEFYEELALKRNDFFLLCTDGLLEKLERKYVRNLLDTLKNPKERIEKLVMLSLSKGGKDNMTAIGVNIDNI